MAKRCPRSTFVGYDHHAQSLAAALAEAVPPFRIKALDEAQ
jgi:hypothetical protein